MAVRVQEAASLRLDEIYQHMRDRWGAEQADRYPPRIEAEMASTAPPSSSGTDLPPTLAASRGEVSVRDL